MFVSTKKIVFFLAFLWRCIMNVYDMCVDALRNTKPTLYSIVDSCFIDTTAAAAAEALGNDEGPLHKRHLYSVSTPDESTGAPHTAQQVLVPVFVEATRAASVVRAKLKAVEPPVPLTVTSIPSGMPPPLWPTGSRSGQGKVLVLDLDQTLLCTSLTTRTYATAPTFSEVVASAQGAELYHVWLRPHLSLFLDSLARLYNIVIFTASAPHYADAIIDRIDPHHRRIKRRYFRGHCTPLATTANSGGNSSARFGKDLSVLDVPLRSVLLVDNDADALSINEENGLLIKSYVPPLPPKVGSPSSSGAAAGNTTITTPLPSPASLVDNDNELLSLIPVLEALFFVSDVRSVLRFARRGHPHQQ